LKREERKHNDKTGIIFLFTLISVVFFMDIYIELSKIQVPSYSVNKTEISFIPSYNNSELVPLPESLIKNTDINFSPIKLSLFFFLLASFSFFNSCLIRASSSKNKLLSHYVSFVNTGQTGYKSSRSPPDFI
jgi:hypothetical protein